MSYFNMPKHIAVVAVFVATGFNYYNNDDDDRQQQYIGCSDITKFPHIYTVST